MKKQCRNCKWFVPRKKESGAVLGECRDAMKRARAVASFAVILDVSMIFDHGGKNCPTFEAKHD